mmetsp:Transcript_16716/g.38151  ORF Transcript_16716/g.38151 Transcript_16716/m.38151 type:complete len:172 (-) Transcript_16716:42-557(-)
MEAAFRREASFVVSPCCVGKLKFSMAGGTSFSTAPLPQTHRLLPQVLHPRSSWMRALLPSHQEFALLARAADFSHVEDAADASTRQLAVMCKEQVELDRSMAAQEHDYTTHLFKLLLPELSTKNDVIVGVPASAQRSAELLAQLFQRSKTRRKRSVDTINNYEEEQSKGLD